MIPPSHQLTSGRPIAGLLSEGREFKLRRLTHSLFTALQKVRRTKDPEILLHIISLFRELKVMGFLPIILHSGKVVEARDLRFHEEAEITLEETKKESDPSVERWLKFQELKRQLESLPEMTRNQLLRDLRIELKKGQVK